MSAQAPTNTRPWLGWVNKTLDLPPETEHTETRLELLKRLEEESYLPPGSWHEAAWIWEGEALGMPPVTTGRLQHEVEQADLREQVKLFAQHFFEIDIPTRQRIFTDLQARCRTIPVLRLWLRQFQPRLNLVMPLLSKESEEVQNIFSFLQAAIVLPPAQLSQLKRQFVSQLSSNKTSFLTALQRIQRMHSDWVKVFPEIFILFQEVLKITPASIWSKIEAVLENSNNPTEQSAVHAKTTQYKQNSKRKSFLKDNEVSSIFIFAFIIAMVGGIFVVIQNDKIEKAKHSVPTKSVKFKNAPKAEGKIVFDDFDEKIQNDKPTLSEPLFEREQAPSNSFEEIQIPSIPLPDTGNPTAPFITVPSSGSLQPSFPSANNGTGRTMPNPTPNIPQPFRP
jgi:hypothetical protein